MKALNSKRRFVISGMSGGIALTPFTYLLHDILDPENTYELAYSMQENIDAILDLNVGESLTMHCNRDEKVGKNLIIIYRNQ